MTAVFGPSFKVIVTVLSTSTEVPATGFWAVIVPLVSSSPFSLDDHDLQPARCELVAGLRLGVGEHVRHLDLLHGRGLRSDGLVERVAADGQHSQDQHGDQDGQADPALALLLLELVDPSAPTTAGGRTTGVDDAGVAGTVSATRGTTAVAR